MFFENKFLVLTLILCNIYCVLSKTVSPLEKQSLVRLGRLRCTKHSVGGEIYVKDYNTLVLENFTYDGHAPDAFFYVGTKNTLPNSHGIRIQYPPGSNEPLRKFNGERVEIKLPNGLSLRDITWFSVWCRAYAVNFGDVLFYSRNRIC
ncbi:unnamed protein product [Lepeophtheirus salmonis]|uniref:(salmon louse) hypothetical protein n=1 Tax=Lepeophtheirus salmonis TaxID=72036 RepID=C1BTM8_LEPSM|nr:protein Skeletor, isoforms B/C-like [Lepeophtheirus salmonis]ACO12381.1 DOMON domain-containing protein CG14681 precursor [Lepeophtheirus salmonis]ADD38141.1 DOMON domain-containing protein CG14681 [Lepeophtheirus salmonis]CAB4069122.1 unnamed protein product [Lepeophtheirus salmonis]CAF3021885.1 unnamed protein product [Lepeophtheirus salmonis]